LEFRCFLRSLQVVNATSNVFADSTATCRDGNSFKLNALLKGHEDNVSALRWSADGLTLASGSMDGTVMVIAARGFRT